MHIEEELEFSSEVCFANENYYLLEVKLTLRKCCWWAWKKHRKGHSILQTWSIVWKARNGFLKAEIQSVCETCWGCPLVLGSGGWGGGDLQSPAQAGWDPVSHLTPVCSLLNVCFKPGHLQLLLPHSPASQRGRNIGTNWRSPDDNTERPVPPP